MICLAEILLQKKVLDKKIFELKNILSKKEDDDVAQELFALVELRQNKLLNIDAANNMSKLNIGGSELTVAAAIRIRDTIKEKIDIITAQIRDDTNELDKVALQAQRDKFYDEYILLTLGIMKNDLQVTLESSKEA
jgi:hypothetical protein